MILEGSDKVLVEQSLKITFKASNNPTEYKALIVGMHLTTNMGVRRMIVRSDSQLVTEQVLRNFQVRDSHLAKYLAKVHSMAILFEEFGLVYVPQAMSFGLGDWSIELEYI